MIKKTIFLFLILSSLSIYSQITKGNWLVGGSATFDTSDSFNEAGEKIQNNDFIAVRPNIGYFFFNKFAAGLSLSYTYTNTKGNSGTISGSGYGIGPFVRYYFLNPEKIVNVVAEANYNYFGDFESNSNSTNYAFSAGPVIFFNSSVALEILAQYSNDNFSTIGSSRSFGIAFGFQIHLEKK